MTVLLIFRVPVGRIPGSRVDGVRQQQTLPTVGERFMVTASCNSIQCGPQCRASIWVPLDQFTDPEKGPPPRERRGKGTGLQKEHWNTAFAREDASPQEKDN